MKTCEVCVSVRATQQIALAHPQAIWLQLAWSPLLLQLPLHLNPPPALPPLLSVHCPPSKLPTPNISDTITFCNLSVCTLCVYT